MAKRSTPETQEYLPSDKAESMRSASKRWGIPARSIQIAADRGVFPPAVSDWSYDTGWMFHEELDTDNVAILFARDDFWMLRVPGSVSKMTQTWLHNKTTKQANRSAWSHRKVMADWARNARPCALTASSELLSVWCSDALGGDKERLEDRWRLVSEWYSTLTKWGISHSNPARTLRLMVVEAPSYLGNQYGY